ncbi:hypothetical protein MSG28_002085 [Choristoneura fumiferana]|uniref:Uncharacterized protein n=1 Tax=Choristoneura fumiferana TaxID=7141 RepID=A0ACC0JTZ9_CHOFU|nr:hypothetical protein MSG28_002085 [Choristoneura fumiferana]
MAERGCELSAPTFQIIQNEPRKARQPLGVTLELQVRKISRCVIRGGSFHAPLDGCFAHPHVRARLEKHMGSNLVSLTDKSYMNDLEDRIRELDEMERLKRLILVGKTPLKECPPELYHHPVFVFWRMVNKEVARASKKRADAFYRKLKASQKNDQSMDEEGELEDEEEEHEALTPEQMIAKCRQELDEQAAVDVERGVRFTDDQFALIKYETNDVKTLKTLTTVEELYSLADKIIGTKRI